MFHEIGNAETTQIDYDETSHQNLLLNSTKTTMVCEHNDALILNDAMNTDENWTFILKIPRDRLATHRDTEYDGTSIR